MKTEALFLAALLLILPVARAQDLDYNRDIRPILSDNCFACHGPDKNKRQADLRLDLRDSALEKQAIVPSKPDESSLIARIYFRDFAALLVVFLFFFRQAAVRLRRLRFSLLVKSMRLLSLLLPALIPLAAVAQETERPLRITDAELGIDLELPDGFVSSPELAALQPDMKYAFLRQSKREGELFELVMVETMGGTIGPPNDDFAEKMASKLKANHVVFKWQDYDLDVFIVPAVVQGHDAATFIAHIPLKRQAIQLHYLGAASKEAELRKTFQLLLQGLKGESNWPVPSEPGTPIAASPSAAESNYYGTILLVISMAAIAIGLIALMIASRWLPKGGVLVIAIAIYVASWQLPNDPIRELRLLTGALRLFGVIAGILGLVYLFLPRKRKANSPLVAKPEPISVAEEVKPSAD